MKDFINYAQKHRKNLIELILIYVFISSFVMIHSGIFKFTGKGILLSAVIVFLSAWVYKSRKLYYAFFLCAVAVYASPVYIKLLVGSRVPFNELIVYLRAGLALACILVLLVTLLNNFIKNKLVRNALKTILIVILTMPIIILWGYYFSSGTWMGADAILAIAQTNFNESLEYLHDYLSFKSCGFLLVFLLLIFCFNKQSDKLSFSFHGKYLTLFCVGILLFNAYVLYKTRINIVSNIGIQSMKGLEKYDTFKKSKTERKQNIKFISSQANGSDGVFVLVIGESQNRDHMSVYGYKRATTPWLEKASKQSDFILFNQAYSCHTHTVPVLTYALTAKNQYNKLALKNSVSLIEVAEAAGYETAWISNQVQYSAWDTPITVIASDAKQQSWINKNIGETCDTQFYDYKLIESLNKLKITSKMLIVIHLMGNHGSYAARYPKEFAKYGEQSNVDRYDNSILYNDYVMENIYANVKKIPNFKGMVYFSDHADAVDENLGHDSSRFVPAMTHVPLYMTFSQEYREQYKDKFVALQNAKNKIFTNDLLFNTMLSVMNVQIPGTYEEQNDIASPKYDGEKNRFKTLYGKKNI